MVWASLTLTVLSVASALYVPVLAGQEQNPAAGQAAGAQAAGAPKQPAWKSRAEYDAFQAIVAATDPNKRIQAAQAFLKAYPSSDFKDTADVAMMNSYRQLNNIPQAMDAAKNALQTNPNNLDAMNFLSFVFPFVYKDTDPNKQQELQNAETTAKHGLEVLQGVQKPAGVSDDQFNTQLKQIRATFNGAVGFAALQQKNYADAIKYFTSATQDNPADAYNTYRLGLAYYYSQPPDYNNAMWYLARSVSLAKAPNSGAQASDLQKFFNQVYVSRHGSDQGEQDVLTQAAASATPPQGFNVTPAPKHTHTGNQAVDAFYDMEDALRVGGEQATQAFQQLKGQPLEMSGKVISVDPSPSGSVVKLAATPESQQASTPDVQVDVAQPGAKNLKPGTLVRFKGTIADFSATPFSITLNPGSINQEDLDAAASATPAPAKHTPTHRRPAH
jgi:tetratricopeptide (TPR) repeat protein